MTSKSTVSWGQQGGPGGRAGRESPIGVCGGGPSREPRPPPAVHLPWPRRASLVTENSPQSRLSRVLTAFPHSLLSTLGQVTGLLWACRGQSQAELEGASAPSPSSRAHEAGGDDSCRDTQGLLPPVLSRGTLGFLTGTPAPTYPFISFLLTLSQKIDTPFHLICILFPLHALPLGSSLPPAPLFFSLSLPSTPGGPALPLSPLCQFLPSGPPQLPPDRFCSPSHWHNQFAHF